MFGISKNKETLVQVFFKELLSKSIWLWEEKVPLEPRHPRAFIDELISTHI